MHWLMAYTDNMYKGEVQKAWLGTRNQCSLCVLTVSDYLQRKTA